MAPMIQPDEVMCKGKPNNGKNIYAVINDKQLKAIARNCQIKRIKAIKPDPKPKVWDNNL